MGCFTLPAEAGEEQLVADLASQWGADAIRDSDGSVLSPEILDLGFEVYSTICLVRADQEYARAHPEYLPQKFLMSVPVTSMGTSLLIDPLSGFCRDKYVLDTLHDARRYWQVIDRTADEVVPDDGWSFDADTGLVTLTGIAAYHVYTVGFLVFQTWDSTSMYNQITNGWQGPHVVSVDPYHRECRDHLLTFLDRYLEGHERTDVVRLTTLAYHFAIDSDASGADAFRDWTGYQDTVSVPALEDFAVEHGYRLTAEDFVDQGYYNASSRVPSGAYRDWMAFIHRFVVEFGRAVVERCRAHRKRTAVFLGDHWIGVEPFRGGCEAMGVDILVGAAEDGVAVRRISDAPGEMTRELRLYPYFFPDVFRDDGDPLAESLSNWIKIRRALMRRPVDRLGYGGRLSLVRGFPEFIDHVAWLASDFRRLKANSGGGESARTSVRVAVLNSWGSWKAWINSFGVGQKFLVKRSDVIQVAGTNLLECLAGLPVDVSFLSFDDVLEGGIPSGVDVVINDGDAETAWSGGSRWAEPALVEEVRGFVARGGGLIGCRGPTATQHQGRYFQLADVLGVDREIGHGLQAAVAPAEVHGHFITSDLHVPPNLGNEETFVFARHPGLELLVANGSHVLASAGSYGSGRSVYFSQLPYDGANARMLLRSILWASRRENELERWFTRNVDTDCAYYPASERLVVVNNLGSAQGTVLHVGDGQTVELSLEPYESRWLQLREGRLAAPVGRPDGEGGVE